MKRQTVALAVTLAFAGSALAQQTASPLPANVACATLPTFDDCVRCGAANYGMDAQQRYCQSNWAPGRQPISYQEYLRLKSGGWQLPMLPAGAPAPR